MSPPVFVSYRRADEPFAAALVYAVLAELPAPQWRMRNDERVRWSGDSGTG